MLRFALLCCVTLALTGCSHSIKSAKTGPAASKVTATTEHKE